MRPPAPGHRDTLFLCIVIMIVLALHAFVIGNIPFADDLYFSKSLKGWSFPGYLWYRYTAWSGRLAVEAALVAVVAHTWLWKALNAAMLLLLCYSAAHLTGPKQRMSLPASTSLAFCLFMLISPGILNWAAWWRTGSINYLWMAALACYGMVAFSDREVHRVLSRLSMMVAAGLAVHNEQVALVVIPLISLFGLKLISDHKWRGWDTAHAAFVLANAAIVFAAPGSRRRYDIETVLRFPNFDLLDSIDKLEIGVQLACRAFIDPTNILMAVIGVAAAICILRTPASRFAKSVFVTAILVFLGVYVAAGVGTPEEALMTRYYIPAALNGLAAKSYRLYATYTVLTFTVLCVSASAASAFWRSRQEFLFNLSLLLLGLGSAAALGFSPTAYASGPRILFIPQVVFLVVVLRILCADSSNLPHRARLMLIVAAVLFSSYRLIAMAF